MHNFFRPAALTTAAAATLLLLAIPAQANSQFTTTANPISIGPPLRLPQTTPVIVSILSNHGFNSPTPATTTVTLPQGRWSEVVLTVTGTQTGRQYDRLCQIWAGGTQIFNGVTPEPTRQGIAWSVKKDVTAYLPMLKGSQSFTTVVDNYVSSVDNGIPNISATLSFYPAHGKSVDPNPWHQAVPSSIVPLSTQPGSDTLNAGQTWNTTVNLPTNVVGATLNLNATAQIGDEFWWDNQPAFREIEISVDGKPAGVVWPYPYIYTGGVNPLIWRPITAIHTLDMPAYHIDLTPFAGLLHGKQTLSITVLNNQGYWLLNGSLLLYQQPGVVTSGAVTTDTLKFPTAFTNGTKAGLSSSSGISLQNETANTQYQIQGTIDGLKGRPFTATVSGTMSFSNDQTNTTQDFWGLVHGAQYVTTTESVTGHGGTQTRTSQTAYTIDSGGGYYQQSSSFFLPDNVTQSLSVNREQSGSGVPTYRSSLYENIQGYGVLQQGSTNISQGATTGVSMFHDSTGYRYHAFVMARGGILLIDQVGATGPSR